MSKGNTTVNDPLNGRDTPREEGGKMTVTKLVYKSQLNNWYQESRYLFNKNFLTVELREKMGLDTKAYQKCQYFKPNQFKIIVDHHQLSEDEVNEILNTPK